MSDYWNKRNVLITGVDGFVGTALANRLIGMGARVSGLLLDYNFGSPFYRTSDYLSLEKAVHGNIGDYDTVERALVESKPDFVFHLAGVTQVVDAREMPRLTYEVNVMGTVNLLEALRRLDWKHCATVIASTDKVYGSPLETPTNEGARLNPVHPYGVSKMAMDMISRSYGVFYNLPLAITRCGNIFGPGDTNWQRLIPGVIRWLLRGERPILRSSGTQVREYNYIGDIINAYLAIARGLMNNQFAAGVSFNISDDTSRFNALTIVSMIKEKMDKLGIAPEILGGAEDEEEAIVLDSSKIRRVLGWRPRITMETGLENTINWLKPFLEEGDLYR